MNLFNKVLQEAFKFSASEDPNERYAKLLASMTKDGVLTLPETPPPNRWKEGRKLDLRDSGITELPNNITKIIGTLILTNCKIKSLPPNLTRVENGSLDLTKTLITELPENLKFIHYTLKLRWCKIKTLPEDLFVQNEIFLDHSDIEDIPRSITTSILHVENTPFANKVDHNQLNRLYPNVELIYV